MNTPFYDPTKSYEENYNEGPFGAFADGKVYQNKGEPKYDYHGQKVFLPFGIPAGPLVNSNFCKAAFEKGFDIAVYKTVRSASFPCHPHPNVLAIHPDGDLTLDKLKSPLTADTNYTDPLSITNSFGVPSRDPDVWQEDAKKAISYAGQGQVLVLSFMGTVREGQTQEEFIDDYVLAARLAAETKAKILEVNLSCPNIGNEGLVCYNIEVTKKVAEGVRNVIGNTPLILKLGYYQDDKEMEKVAEIAQEYAGGVAGINTLQAEVRDKNGNPALPGKNRLRSGVCGAGIRWAGLDFVKRMKKIREKRNFTFKIEGVGGVTRASDYFEFIKTGADSVMSATGAMWNPYLGQEIKEK
ncbi:hypothetical protein A2773_05610 [Candidatus Gottesmanbacteria bacterium RIFCSPHIGHO2_01_FULL_39_10]|uniref:Dihydroorotate dehydrogenase catalytic domain-containing protein n=1 Tax=Candidatus Gottesmanbacteria bacterium RIFCSPHIGHO2_01_FULL_39_10 TaxID=1798375 RepID=A0A1F5ZQB5_9BACT|nr:MAG: hypothetical protein A2773_05610 [Candidatus Gottesmanbacteria bacterium RIFCSPHIGHO2_01_FULL_39_10]